MPIIYLETRINSEVNIVFDLSRSVDLHVISTEQTNEKAISGVTSGLVQLNDTITWKAKHFGVYHILTTKIVEYKHNHSFVDEMVSGIFKGFRHEHIIKDIDGQVLMIDEFDYTSPLGVLGRIADGLFLKRYMTDFLKTRNQIIKQYAESDQWKLILK